MSRHETSVQIISSINSNLKLTSMLSEPDQLTTKKEPNQNWTETSVTKTGQPKNT